MPFKTVSALAILGLIGLGLSFWIARPNNINSSSMGFTERAARDAQPIYSTIPQVPISAEADEIMSILTMAPVRGVEKIGRDRAHLVLSAAAAFLANRFGRGDPVAYRTWRTSNRFRWKNRDALEESWTISRQYEKYTHRTASSLPEMFDTLFREKAIANGGFNRVVGMAGDAAGMSIVFGVMTPGNPIREMLGGRLPSVIWHGGMSGTHCSWFTPERPYKERLARGEHVDYAEIGIIMSHADGSRRPLIMTFIWDPVPSQWELQVLNTNNEPSARLLSIDF
ncbi:MAG: hypothetical protein JNK58_05445 [Phycisphaerae bacterium]|nr:hypothetical protein [Phycisphaerae bacterium]